MVLYVSTVMVQTGLLGNSMIYEFSDQLSISYGALCESFTAKFSPKVFRYESKLPLSWQGKKKFVIEGVSENEARDFLKKFIEENKMSQVKAKDLVPGEQVVDFETISVPKSFATLVNKPGVGMLLVALDAVVTEANKEYEKENNDLKLKITALNETIANQSMKIGKQSERIQSLEEWTDNFKLPNRKKPEDANAVNAKKV